MQIAGLHGLLLGMGVFALRPRALTSGWARARQHAALGRAPPPRWLGARRRLRCQQLATRPAATAAEPPALQEVEPHSVAAFGPPGGQHKAFPVGTNTSRQAVLRRKHLWSLDTLLAAIRARSSPASHTLVLLDNVRYAANVAVVLRHLSVLLGSNEEDSELTALLLSRSRPEELPELGFSRQFLKSTFRIALVEVHKSRPTTPLVVLPDGEITGVLNKLRDEGYLLVALENVEACLDEADAPPQLPIWDAALGARGSRVLLIAGGEDCGLGPEVLRCCDFQCYVPSSTPCSLAIGAALRQELGEEGQNPTMNVAGAATVAVYERLRQLHTTPAG